MNWVRLSLQNRAGLGALFIAAFALSCSSTPRPRARPAGRMFDRAMAQLGVVRLVVQDPARADRVERLYEEIETIYLEGEAARRQALGKAFVRSRSGEPDEQQVFEAVAEANEISAESFEKYIAIQMELRRHLSRDEFVRLSEVR